MGKRNSIVSIIIPLFNANPYLDYSFTSVLNQTYKDLEIIAIDDGSSDGTMQSVLDFNDSRIVYKWQSNRGKNFALNLGLELAKGEFLMFLDQDDYIPSNYVASMLQALNTSGSDVVSSNVLNIKGIKELRNRVFIETNKPSNQTLNLKLTTLVFNEKILYQYFFGHQVGHSFWNKLYRHQFLENFKFDEKYQLDDRPNLYRFIFEINSLTFTENLYIFHLHHDLSMGHNKMFEPVYLLELIHIDSDILKAITERDLSESFIKKVGFKINSEIIKNNIRLCLVSNNSTHDNISNSLFYSSASLISKLLLLIYKINVFINSSLLKGILIRILYRKFNHQNLLDL